MPLTKFLSMRPLFHIALHFHFHGTSVANLPSSLRDYTNYPVTDYLVVRFRKSVVHSAPILAPILALPKRMQSEQPTIILRA